MKRLLALALVVCACALGQNATIMPDPNPPFLDANGVPLAGGKVYTYAAGTTTLQATYTDSSATTPNTNPVILDGAGRGSIWLGAGAYKVVVKDAIDVLQWTRDNVSSTALTAKAIAGGTSSTFGTLAVTGAANVGGALQVTGAITAPAGVALGSGTALTPATGRTFTTPILGGTFYDASTATSNAAAQGDGAYAPIASVRVFESGGATAAALYSEYHASAGATGGAYGLSANVSADPGSVPRVVAHNWTIQDASHYWLNGCTRTSNVMTCSIATGGSNPPFSLLDSNGVQHCFYVTGTSDTGLNNGGTVQCPTSVTSSTVTFANSGSNATITAGGWLAPSHQVFGFELNQNNANHDPGHITASAGTPIPVWGYVSQNTPFTWTNPTGGAAIPNQPISAGYFAAGTSCVTAGCSPQYTGVLIQDAIDDLVTAGYPQSGGSVSTAKSAFRARPIAAAISGTNYRSQYSCWDSSTWNGASSFVETSYCMGFVPNDNTSNVDNTFTLFQKGWESTPVKFYKQGHMSVDSGSSSLVGYGFNGWTNGLYNASGVTTNAGAFAGTSTIDANGGFKVNGTAGATTTVTCTGGQHLTSITVAGGLITAVGACS